MFCQYNGGRAAADLGGDAVEPGEPGLAAGGAALAAAAAACRAGQGQQAGVQRGVGQLPAVQLGRGTAGKLFLQPATLQLQQEGRVTAQVRDRGVVALVWLASFLYFLLSPRILRQAGTAGVMCAM